MSDYKYLPTRVFDGNLWIQYADSMEFIAINNSDPEYLDEFRDVLDTSAVVQAYRQSAKK